MSNDFIKIEKVSMNHKMMCEIEMYGHTKDLASMIFSCMKTNEQFANIVLEASEAFMNSNCSQASLN